MSYFVAASYNIFKNGNGSTSMYKELYKASTTGAIQIYHLLMQIGVYACAFAVISAGILFLYIKTSPAELLEGKRRMIKISVVTILIFGIVGLVSLIISAAPG